MKAAQEAAKAANTCKGKKNIFQSYLKASVVKLVLFFYLSAAHRLFQILLFRSTNTASPQVCPAIHFNLFCLPKKAVKDFFHTIRAILQPLYLRKPYTLLHQNL
jgi:hypothetical protein